MLSAVCKSGMGLAVLVLGFPRSGTSAAARALEARCGADFLQGAQSVDCMYPAELGEGGYMQRLDVHLLCLRHGLNLLSAPLALSAQRVVVRELLALLPQSARSLKEPYLLWVLPALREAAPGLLVALVLRAPGPAVRSCQAFVLASQGESVAPDILEHAWFCYVATACLEGRDGSTVLWPMLQDAPLDSEPACELLFSCLLRRGLPAAVRLLVALGVTSPPAASPQPQSHWAAEASPLPG